jgi:transcriptional regulator with XRE-family HTH domain
MRLYKLGQNIKNKRIDRNMTQEQLAEKSEISSVFLSQIENAHKVPSLETLYKIVDALEIPIESVFRDELQEEAREKNKIEMLLEGKTEKEKIFLIDILSYISWKLSKDKIDF